MPATSQQPAAEAAESAAELWALYLEALRRGLLIPPEVAFMAASSAVPLALETESVIDPVPLPRALNEVYLYGNTIPRWSTAYQPSADGHVYGQYDSFVFSIAVPPGGGPQYRTVEQARALLDEVARQVVAGSGSLVMAIATDAGTSTVPRYDPGPLGKPGYSQWLEQAILAWVHGLSPEVDVTVRSDEVKAAAATPPSALAAEVVTLRLVIQSVTYLSIRPGAWFVASLLRTYTRPEDFIPGTPFATQPIWGPDGIFNLIPTGLWAGFRPTIEVTLTPKGFARVTAMRAAASAAGAPATLRIGPFAIDLLTADPEALRLDPDASAITWTETSLQGILLGIGADHPNTTEVPG